MKRSASLLTCLSITMCGCSGSTTADLPPDDGIAVTCGYVSFVLDPALGSGASCEIVPEIDDPYFGNPEFVWIELEGYPLSDEWSTEQIAVYPVAEAAAAWPDEDVPGLVSQLQALIGGSPLPDQSVELPFLIDQESGEFFHAHYEVISFASGKGTRYLTGFTQGGGHVSNEYLLYTYQALTDDGEFWISVVFTIHHPMLEADTGYPSNMTDDEWDADWRAYVNDKVNELNSQPSDSFSPTIDALDALVESITITP